MSPVRACRLRELRQPLSWVQSWLLLRVHHPRGAEILVGVLSQWLKVLKRPSYSCCYLAEPAVPSSPVPTRHDKPHKTIVAPRGLLPNTELRPHRRKLTLNWLAEQTQLPSAISPVSETPLKPSKVGKHGLQAWPHGPRAKREQTQPMQQSV